MDTAQVCDINLTSSNPGSIRSHTSKQQVVHELSNTQVNQILTLAREGPSLQTLKHHSTPASSKILRCEMKLHIQIWGGSGKAVKASTLTASLK